jgi:hypothetical protein
MNVDRFVFSQIIDFLPKRYFERLVASSADRTQNWSLTYWNQLLALIYGQLDGCKSLRELTSITQAHKSKCFHLGFGAPIDKTALSRADNVRDPAIFEKMAFHMMEEAKKRGIPKEFTLHGKYYAFDSTTISLCMSVFEWATFKSTKSGVKMHTMLDIALQIPSFFRITNANINDVNAMDAIPYEPHACYIFDRGYYDLARLYRINVIGSFFVIREKGHPLFDFELGEELLDGEDNVLADQTVKFATDHNIGNYPCEIRRIVYYAPELKRSFVYYTNNFYLSASEIAYLYKCRWQVELFL